MSPISILVIDDEVQIRRFLKIGLESNGFKLIEASNGEDGIQEAISRKPDLVLLDLGLPGLQGLDVLRKMREWTQTPIIVLSVQDDEDIKVKALDQGANDYLTKPFGMNELLARIRAAMRHRRDDLNLATPLHLRDLVIDLSAHIVKKAGSEIHLTATEFRLFAFFVRNLGKVLTHKQITKEIWGTNQENEIAYLRIYIRNLRKKLESDPSSPSLIHTEAGIGYRLRDIPD